MNIGMIKEVVYMECHQARRSFYMNRYEYMSYYVSRCVEVEHSSPSYDYRSLMYIVNRREITNQNENGNQGTRVQTNKFE